MSFFTFHVCEAVVPLEQQQHLLLRVPELVPLGIEGLPVARHRHGTVVPVPVQKSKKNVLKFAQSPTASISISGPAPKQRVDGVEPQVVPGDLEHVGDALVQIKYLKGKETFYIFVF